MTEKCRTRPLGPGSENLRRASRFTPDSTATVYGLQDAPWTAERCSQALGRLAERLPGLLAATCQIGPCTDRDRLLDALSDALTYMHDR